MNRVISHDSGHGWSRQRHSAEPETKKKDTESRNKEFVCALSHLIHSAVYGSTVLHFERVQRLVTICPNGPTAIGVTSLPLCRAQSAAHRRGFVQTRWKT